MKNPILVALDVSSGETALRLAKRLAPCVGGFKVGKELFTRGGPEIVRELRAMGGTVFLDLKFHDIPNTVSRAVQAAAELDVQMLTVHTSGGQEMMRAAAEAAGPSTAAGTVTESGSGSAPAAASGSGPLILGVTVLTSLDRHGLHEVGVEDDVAGQVERLALLAVRSGLRGLVCSPLEITALRQMLPADMTLVTPGIRPDTAGGDDQKRTLTPREAIDAGADWLVIGRPIIAAPDPLAAAERILGGLTA